MSKKVLILTGPGGVGKTTIAEILSGDYGFTMVDGDDLDTEFFPKGGQWLPEKIENLKNAHQRILKEVKKKFDNCKNNVVLDYIIFQDYLNFLICLRKNLGKI